MKIITTDDYQLMSETAAELIIKKIKNDESAVLGLPTGRTPLGLYEKLIKACAEKKISFREVKTFNLDEYVGLAKTNPASFHAFMKNKFFDQIDIKPDNIFIPDGQADNLDEESDKYENLIKKAGGIDLLILGIGLDGHLGFNEPGSGFDSLTRIVDLKEQTRLTNAKYFAKPADVPYQAITMGLATIMDARKIILMAAGAEKSTVIKQALTGKIDESVPASILQTHKNLTVILDHAAAQEMIANKM